MADEKNKEEEPLADVEGGIGSAKKNVVDESPVNVNEDALESMLVSQGINPSLLDPTAVPEVEGRKMKLKNWARLIKGDDEMSEVSLEQLMRVKMMHDQFSEGASFSFNYNVLLLVASVIASLGLASNSVATIIASMLVSPIMGPVVGMAYGTAIFDWKLVRKSMFTEAVSLVFCIAMGAIIAACCSQSDLAHNWVTNEMSTRGDKQNFLVALPVAFFSGLGVAVSLLDQQVNSLVGVAISASLLPPACNCGLVLVAFAFVDEDKIEETDSTIDDFREASRISILLTLANIALIWLSSIIMFRLKEILPIKKKVFWLDLTIARNIYRKKARWSSESVGKTAIDAEPNRSVGDEETNDHV